MSKNSGHASCLVDEVELCWDRISVSSEALEASDVLVVAAVTISAMTFTVALVAGKSPTSSRLQRALSKSGSSYMKSCCSLHFSLILIFSSSTVSGSRSSDTFCMSCSIMMTLSL